MIYKELIKIVKHTKKRMDSYKATTQQKTINITAYEREKAEKNELLVIKDASNYKKQLPIHINGMKSNDYMQFSCNLTLVIESLDYLDEFPFDLFYDFDVHTFLIQKLMNERLANEDICNILNLLSRYFMKNCLDGVELLMNTEFPEILLSYLENNCDADWYQYIFHCLSGIIRYSVDFKHYFFEHNYVNKILTAEEFLNNFSQCNSIYKYEMISLIKALFLPKVRYDEKESLMNLFSIIIPYSSLYDSEIMRKIFQILRHFIVQFPDCKEFVYNTKIIQSVILDGEDLSFLGSFLYLLRTLCYETQYGESLISSAFLDQIATCITENHVLEISDSLISKLNTILIDINNILLSYPLSLKIFVQSNLFPLVCKIMNQNIFLITIQCVSIICNLFISKDTELIQAALNSGIFNIFEKILYADEPYFILKILDALISFFQNITETQNDDFKLFVYNNDWIKEKIEKLSDLQDNNISEKLKIINDFDFFKNT